MRRSVHIAVMALVALFAIVAAPSAQEINRPATSMSPRQLVVIHRVPAAGVDPAQIARTLGLRHRDSQHLMALRLTISVFELEPRADLATIERVLRAGLDVLAIDVARDYFGYESSFELNARNLQYALDQLNAGSAAQVASGRGVRVALIDGGVDDRHGALKGKLLAHIDLVGQATNPQPASAYDELRHGTGMAGVILASGGMVGLAPGARVIAIKAFSLRGGDGRRIRSTSDRIARAIEIALRLRAQVINMSFGGPRDKVIEFVVGEALARGVVLVAAAGREAPYPAAYPGVIGVAAVNSAGRVDPASVELGHVAVCASGIDIITTAPGGGYQTLSGASLAAAHVSALVALLAELRPGLGPADALALLRRSGRTLPEDQAASHPDRPPLIDVGAAIAMAGGMTGEQVGYR